MHFASLGAWSHCGRNIDSQDLDVQLSRLLGIHPYIAILKVDRRTLLYCFPRSNTVPSGSSY